MAALTPDELAKLLPRVEMDGGKVVHSTASVGGHDLGTLSAFMTRREGDVEFVGASGLYLAPGVIYRSAWTQVFEIGKPITVVSGATLEISGRTIPHTVLSALAGRHVSAVVEHPALADPRLIIQSASKESMIVVKSRSGPIKPKGDPTTPGFALVLPQLLEDVNAGPWSSSEALGREDASM